MNLKTYISVDLHFGDRGRQMSAFSHKVAALTLNSWPACPDSGLTLNSNSPLPFTLYPEKNKKCQHSQKIFEKVLNVRMGVLKGVQKGQSFLDTLLNVRVVRISLVAEMHLS